MSRRSEDKKWAITIHLSALSGILFPLGMVLGPALVWYIKRNDSNYLDVQGKRAIDFQLTILIISFIATIFSVIIRPFSIIASLVVTAGLIFSIIAAFQIRQHSNYKYPYALNIVNRLQALRKNT